MPVVPGQPLSEDVARYVADRCAGAASWAGPQPPVMLATLRDRMVALGGQRSPDGVLWANGARSFLPHSLAAVPTPSDGPAGYVVANMIPTVIDEDRTAAAALHRREPDHRTCPSPTFTAALLAGGRVQSREMDAIEPRRWPTGTPSGSPRA